MPGWGARADGTTARRVARRPTGVLPSAAELVSAEMIHLVTAEEIAALNVLMRGPRTAREVAARTTRNAWAVLRGMELREPPLAFSEPSEEGEVWEPTLLGRAALEEGTRRRG